MNSVIPATQASPATEDIQSETTYEIGYEAVKAEFASVDPNAFIPINIEIFASVILVLGKSATIKKYRDDIVRELPRFDIAKFDKLDAYAQAASVAQTRYVATAKPIEPIQDMVDELTKLRELLVSDVSALAKRKLLDGSRLDELQGPVGFKNVAGDVMILSTVMRGSWDAIQGKTAVQLSELRRAEQLAENLATALGVRDEDPAKATLASDTRQRAFTLFVSTYDEVRRAIAYLRWHTDDADSIAPSLYAGRGPAKKKAVVTPPAPQAGANPLPAAPAAPVNGAAAGQRVPDGTAAHFNSLPGMPGNDPFGR